MNRNYDIVIVGGGVMGCSTAFHLKSRDNGLKVAVVEKDPTYERASSTLSWSNVRINFSLKENIRISQYTKEILDRFEDEMSVGDERPFISWRPEGNLFLFDRGSYGPAREALALQEELGCTVQWLEPGEIRDRYPLYNLEGVVGGTLGLDDGYLDGYAMLMAYRNKAKSLGTDFLNDEVVSIHTRNGAARGVELASGTGLKSDVVVNCAGAWAAGVARTVGIDLPVAPTKRQVFAVDTAIKPEGNLPLTVWPSGFCFRSETGDLLLVGKAMLDDPVGIEFSWDEKRFTERLWPELAHVVPAFDTLKLKRGWAGLYAINLLDQNAILGEWPDLKGFYLANGFSGHGLQQAPAVGRYLTELILDLPLSLDLSIFGPGRIAANEPINEMGIV